MTTDQKQRRRLLMSVGMLTALTVTGVGLANTGEWGSAGYGGVFVVALLSSMTFVVPGPSLATVIVAGATLDPVLVGAIMGVGSALGELPGFVAGSANAKVVVQSSPPRVSAWMRRRPSLTVFLLAAVPNFLFDFASVLAGAARMSWSKFLAVTVAGKIVRFTLAALGASGTLRPLWWATEGL